MSAKLWIVSASKMKQRKKREKKKEKRVTHQEFGPAYQEVFTNFVVIKYSVIYSTIIQ